MSRRLELIEQTVMDAVGRNLASERSTFKLTFTRNRVDFIVLDNSRSYTNKSYDICVCRMFRAYNRVLHVHGVWWGASKRTPLLVDRLCIFLILLEG